MENKLHTAGIICFGVLIILASCYFCGNSQEQKLTQQTSNYLAKQLEPEFQKSINNYIQKNGYPPASFKQLLDESNEPYLVEIKKQLNSPNNTATLIGNTLKIPIPDSNIYMYFYINGSKVTTEVK